MSHNKESIFDDEPMVKRPKLLKHYEEDDDVFIYAVGTQIHFTADINDYTIERLIRLFTKIIGTTVNKNKHKKDEKIEITYIVDSPGGSVSAAFKFIDFLNLTKSKYSNIIFTSIITGTVASAGTIISVVADRKYMTPNAYAMIHELSAGNRGKYTQLMSYSKHLIDIHNNIVQIYLDNVSICRKKLEHLLKDETWFTAEEYKKLGFVDEIKPTKICA